MSPTSSPGPILCPRAVAAARPPRAGGAVCLLLAVALATLAAGGCSSAARLMPRPNLYAGSHATPFDAVPLPLRTPDIRVLFATDRFPEQAGANAPLLFKARRSSHLQVGHCRVRIEGAATWERLVELSLAPDRPAAANVAVGEPDVVLRYPGTFWRQLRIDDPSDSYEHFEERRLATRARLHLLLRAELEKTDRKEVFLYVHGYNNTFDDAIVTIANLWHFMGRKGVPIAYTWPAGSGGLTGYTTDDESGEFTIFHLKLFLEDLAASPDVEKISILAHSRGTDVTIAAIRELGIGLRGGGRDPRVELKLADVVLASPDIDMEVAAQRMSSERITDMMGRLTMYLSPEDKALLLSRWLHQSFSRIGVLDVESFAPESLQAVSYFRNVDCIDTRVETDYIGHSYFYNNPSVSSDVILLLGEGRAVGADAGRPLEPLGPGLWRLREGYPLPPRRLLEALTDLARPAGTSP